MDTAPAPGVTPALPPAAVTAPRRWRWAAASASAIAVGLVTLWFSRSDSPRPLATVPAAPLPPPSFTVVAAAPAADALVSRNAAVQVFFSRAIRPATATALRVVALGPGESETPVAGSLEVVHELASEGARSSGVIFKPLAPCPAPTPATDGCWAAGQRYRVSIDTAQVRAAASDEPLACPDDGCTWTFTATEAVAGGAPALALPAATTVASDAVVRLSRNAGSVPTYVRLVLDRGAPDGRTLVALPVGPDWDGTLTVDTTGLAVGTQRFFTVEAFDSAWHRSEATAAVGVYAPSCANGRLDDGELRVDCGGPACPACPPV